jgi:hypothetical protein
MDLLKIVGIALIASSAISGIAIYIFSFSFIEDVKLTTISFLFILTLLTGTAIYCIGISDLEGIIYASSILLILGGISAMTILLSELQILACERKYILWILFLLGVPVGAIGFIAANPEFVNF